MDLDYLERETNSPQMNHLDDDYFYELWVLECQM